MLPPFKNVSPADCVKAVCTLSTPERTSTVPVLTSGTLNVAVPPPVALSRVPALLKMFVPPDWKIVFSTLRSKVAPL